MMFKLTVELKGNLSVLHQWLDHFQRTGTPAGIVEHDGYFSVWRSGQRMGGVAPTDKPEGVLRVSNHNFDKLWFDAGGKVAKENIRRDFTPGENVIDDDLVTEIP